MDAADRENDDRERLQRFAEEFRDIYIVKKHRSPEVTQVWLAQELGRDQTTISHWLRGFREPPPRDVFRLEKALHLSSGRLSHHLGFVPGEDEYGMVGFVTTEDAVRHDPYIDDASRELLLAMYDTARRLAATAQQRLQEEINAETLRQIEEEAAG